LGGAITPRSGYDDWRRPLGRRQLSFLPPERDGALVTPWVLRLLVANVGMFFVQQTMPGLTSQLDFFPPLVLRQPWTPFTYMFLHAGVSHLFFNMLGLYFFGIRVESRIGSNRFITLYLISGFAGAILHFFFAFGNPVIGASGAVLGVMFAFARYWPHDKIYIWGILPVEARVLVVITTILAL